MARTSLVGFLFVGAGALLVQQEREKRHWSEDEASVLQRMQYWSPAEEALPSTGKYLLFTTDAGGLNNIRIGWEMTGLVALRTGRTLVLPPKAGMYLLDFGPWNTRIVGDTSNWTRQTAVEDLINLKQLKGVLPTLTAEEFEKEVGMTWAEAKEQSEATPQKDYTVCHFSDWDRFTSKFLYMEGKSPKREGFSCGEWWLRGGPRTEFRQEMTEADWALLRHGFVWHPDAFAIAAKAVHYLGLFQYVAVHARYGDFAEHQAQRSPEDIYDNWKPLIDNATALYISTDRQENFYDGFAERHNIRLVMWPDLFTEATGGALSDVKKQFSPERFYKMTGLVEELICTFARVFVGTDRSSFTGHIERMRIHSDAPVKMRLVHTDGDPFILAHGGHHGPDGVSREIQVPLERIQQSISDWDKREWIVPAVTKGDSFMKSTRPHGLV